MTAIDCNGDDTEETVPLSVRVPKRVIDRVLMAGADARCRHKTQAVIHVLEAGLEFIDRQKAKPLRLEKMVGRVEALVATQLAMMLTAFPDMDDDAINENRREILEEL
jgi:hypothetical protein